MAARYTGKRLWLLNWCCSYLWVTLLSEVIAGGGSKLRAQMLKGTTPLANLQYVWLNQGKPLAKSWKLWKEAINGLTEWGWLR